MDPVTHLQRGGAPETSYNNVPEFTLGSTPEYINAEVSSGKNHYFLMTPVAYNNNKGGFSIQSGPYSFKYQRVLDLGTQATTTSWVTRSYSQEHAFPYFDGQASISRTVRPYPSWLIFKPAMFLTSFLLVKYWIYNKNII